MSISPTFKITTGSVYSLSNNMRRQRNKQWKHWRRILQSMVNTIRNWRKSTIIWWRYTLRIVIMSALGTPIRNRWIFRRLFTGTIMILRRVINSQHFSNLKKWNSHRMAARANTTIRLSTGAGAEEYHFGEEREELIGI